MTQAEIDQLIKDQIGQDTGATPNPFLAQAQANYAVTAQADAAHRNANLIAIYQQGYANWAAQVQTGRVPISPVPPEVANPPAAYMALTASDGWTYVVRGSDPVCPVPAPPIPPPPPNAPVPPPTNIKNAPPGDTLPAGYIVTAPDGTKWQKHMVPTPFGTEAFYVQVS